jgi:DNA-binding transcriptional regulator YiaG
VPPAPATAPSVAAAASKPVPADTTLSRPTQQLYRWIDAQGVANWTNNWEEFQRSTAIARGARRQVRGHHAAAARGRSATKENDGASSDGDNPAAVGWKRLMEAAPAIPQVSEEDAKAARLSPRLIESLRRRLGLSQTALARLVGVSSTAVAHWVAGDSMPTGQNRMTLVALRRVGKREVKDLFARRVKETPSRKRRTRKRSARRARKGLKR